MKYIIFMVFITMSCIVSFNTLSRADIACNTAWAQVENQLQRRADLIPNLVSTVRGYSIHEKDVLQDVAYARSRLGNVVTPQDSIEANTNLSNALSRLLIVVENYPNLKADQHFQSLIVELQGTENEITVARKEYNEVIAKYNVHIKSFPGNLFSRLYGFEERPFYKATNRDTPKVEF